VNSGSHFRGGSGHHSVQGRAVGEAEPGDSSGPPTGSSGYGEFAAAGVGFVYCGKLAAEYDGEAQARKEAEYARSREEEQRRTAKRNSRYR
jgi:hypothetical protein